MKFKIPSFGRIRIGFILDSRSLIRNFLQEISPDPVFYYRWSNLDPAIFCGSDSDPSILHLDLNPDSDWEKTLYHRTHKYYVDPDPCTSFWNLHCKCKFRIQYAYRPKLTKVGFEAGLRIRSERIQIQSLSPPPKKKIQFRIRLSKNNPDPT